MLRRSYAKIHILSHCFFTKIKRFALADGRRDQRRFWPK
jgi:hypothetical protein